MLADKAMTLWQRTTTYFLLRERWVVDGKKATIGQLSNDSHTITFKEIIAAARRDNEHQARARMLLRDVLQCSTMVRTTREENSATGLATTPSASLRYKRHTYHSADYMHHTHAGKATMNEMMLHGGPDVGQLGSCKKSYDASPHWTPGIFTAQCSCVVTDPLSRLTRDTSHGSRCSLSNIWRFATRYNHLRRGTLMHYRFYPTPYSLHPLLISPPLILSLA